MTTALTIVITLLLIAGAARMIHLLNAQHSERIALHHYSRFHPGGRGTRSGPARPVPGQGEEPRTAPPAWPRHQEHGR
ncbi:hypothetical protein ACFPFX_37795 [Streptomyces mauvecolor]|uniref:Secreted protein n=1 Tax=Streptomyces mauvecolor TaxID=58345 RepID=A0ABV9V0Q9_9ACTN